MQNFKFTGRKLTKIGIFYAVLFIAALPLLVRKIHANDFWKALYSGRYLALFNHFPHHSTFTYSPVNDFLVRDAFNWLGNLFFIGGYSVGGTVGFCLFRIVVILGIVVLYHSLVSFRLSPLHLILFVIFICALNQKLVLRTAFFSLPFSALLFWLWHQIWHENRINWIYLIPVLLVVWSNIHGSYLVGWGLLSVLVLGKIIDHYLVDSNRPRLLIKLVLILLVSAPMVTYIKPFPETSLVNKISGSTSRIISAVVPSNTNNSPPDLAQSSSTEQTFYESVRSLLQKSLFKQRSFRSSEFNFPLENFQYIFVPTSLILLVLYFLSVLFTKRKQLSSWFLFLVAAYFGISYLRTVPYLALIALPVILRTTEKSSYRSIVRTRICTYSCFLIICVWIGIVVSFIQIGSVHKLTGEPPQEFGFGTIQRFDRSFASKVLKKFPERKVANTYNTGGFLIWSWWPYKKVLMDSKGSAYRSHFWRRITNRGVESYILSKNIHLLIVEWSNPSVLLKLRPDPNWKKRVTGRGLGLFEYDN
jgi:hypothetical protein